MRTPLAWRLADEPVGPALRRLNCLTIRTGWDSPAHPNVLSYAGEMRPVRIPRSFRAHRNRGGYQRQHRRTPFISISCQYMNKILRFCWFCGLGVRRFRREGVHPRERALGRCAPLPDGFSVPRRHGWVVRYLLPVRPVRVLSACADPFGFTISRAPPIPHFPSRIL